MKEQIQVLPVVAFIANEKDTYRVTHTTTSRNISGKYKAMNLVVVLLVVCEMRIVVHTSENQETIPENCLAWMRHKNVTKEEDMVDPEESGMLVALHGVTITIVLFC